MKSILPNIQQCWQDGWWDDRGGAASVWHHIQASAGNVSLDKYQLGCLAGRVGLCAAWKHASGVSIPPGRGHHVRAVLVLLCGLCWLSELSWLTILHLCCRVSCSFLGAVLAVRAVPFGLLLGVMAGACVLVRGHAVARANHRVRIHGVPAKDRAVLAHVQCRIRANPPSCKMSGLGPKVLS